MAHSITHTKISQKYGSLAMFTKCRGQIGLRGKFLTWIFLEQKIYKKNTHCIYDVTSIKCLGSANVKMLTI